MPITENNGISWENKFGKSFDDMDTDQKLITMYAVLNGLTIGQKEIKKITDCIPRHEVYFKLIGTAIVLILIPLVIAFCKMYFHI